MAEVYPLHLGITVDDDQLREWSQNHVKSSWWFVTTYIARDNRWAHSHSILPFCGCNHCVGHLSTQLSPLPHGATKTFLKSRPYGFHPLELTVRIHFFEAETPWQKPHHPLHVRRTHYAGSWILPRGGATREATFSAPWHLTQGRFGPR